MKRALPACLIACLSICYFNGYTQTDSSRFDLGRVTLRKDFTQNITIKGTDLERMPYSSLTEALNVWLHGVYTNINTIQYVVDGTLAADVNQYSVYDIEEVTLVQNAVIQVNGSTNQQQLVLVKTKRNLPGKSGITVAAQSFLSKLDKTTNPTDKDKSETKFFHQLHLSAYRNGKNIQYGASVNYLRDVLPYYKDNYFNTETNPRINRFRFNGWLQAQLGTKNRLLFSMSYVPQPAKTAFTRYGATRYDSVGSRTKEYIINPTLTLQSAWVKNLHNELSVSYAGGYYKNESYQGLVDLMFSNPNYILTEGNRTIKSTNIVASNHTTYQIQAGNWQIEPALNVMFRYIEFSDKLYSRTTSLVAGTPGLPVSSAFSASSEGLRRMFLLTPSLNLYYKNILNLQGGMLYDISDYNGAKPKKIFPFASLAADILKMGANNHGASLKIFGSWAQSALLADYSGRLTDHSSSGMYAANTNITMFVTGVTPLYFPFTRDSSTWMVQTGASFHSPNDRLIIDYNYERRDFTPLAYRYVPTTSGYTMVYYQPVFISSAHRLGIMAKVIDKKELQWFSGVNVTTIDLKTDDGYFEGVTASGDYNTEDPSWTGGFINRVSYKRLTLGADVLYHFDQQQLPGTFSTAKTTSLVLQNVYAGYQFRLPKGRTMEVYADCRNLVRNEKSSQRPRKFYGLGLKAQL
jgi:hypothetical protein